MSKSSECVNQSELPLKIRVSSGTAIILNLIEGKLDAKPTTAYLMTYKLGKCAANCGFCPQAKSSKSSTELLSRVTWPSFPTLKVVSAIAGAKNEGKIKRVCIQALNYAEVFADLEMIVKEIRKWASIPISVSCQPLNLENIEGLANVGVDRLGIALDAATQGIFDKVKGKGTGSPYDWQNQFRQLAQALSVFGEDNVSTHVIVGLGETEKEAVEVIQRCVNLGILPALFAFTPVHGTALENESPPKLESYRRVQLARYLIVGGKTKLTEMHFNLEGKITGYGLTNEALNAEVESGFPFQTSGCQDCNRPFYNEKPSGPLYNFPAKPNEKEIERIKKQLS
jgi:lipoyl synthase